jgi:recombination protein RecA
MTEVAPKISSPTVSAPAVAKEKTSTTKIEQAVAVADAAHSGADREKKARLEALSGVVHQIEKSYGKGSIQKLGQSSSVNVETFPSGSVTLDMAMGGGYPRGRVIEIYGPESSGKTTLALHAVAEMQKMGGKFLNKSQCVDKVCTVW